MAKKNKTPKHLKPWMDHLQKTKDKHPNKTLAENMKLAKKTYKKQIEFQQHISFRSRTSKRK